MKDKKLTIIINKPVNEVFSFTTNPDNTPKWIDSIVHEETNEEPKLGTIYKNQNQQGNWAEYQMTEYDKDKTFTMSQIGSNYHVKYTLTSTTDHQTEFEYYEWVDNGTLEEPFTQDALEKLKTILESS
jgi:uncharacterized protein YndB with AHSA1/START domain